MKYIILIIVSVLLSVVNGYSQYRISIDSSFNFGDKERFLKQSTGLQGSVVAAQLNSRGNYLIAGNYLRFNQRNEADVYEITPSGEVLRVYSQIVTNASQSQTISSISDMFVDKKTEEIYLLARIPFEGLKTPKREETGVIVLDRNLNEIRRLSVPDQIIGEEGFNWIVENVRFLYSKKLDEIFIDANVEYQGSGNTLFKVNSDRIVQVLNHPNYYFKWRNGAVFLGDKLISILGKRNIVNYRNNGRERLCITMVNQFSDTTMLDSKLNWEYYEDLFEYSPNQVLVCGWDNGRTKIALINNNLDIDTNSLIVKNMLDFKLEYIHTEGSNVLLRKFFAYKSDTTFALNNHYWEMNIDGSNLRPSEINWYPDQNNQNKADDWVNIKPILGTGKYFAQFSSTIFLIENGKVNSFFLKKLGPDLTRIYDIQPTLNNQWYVLGDFRYYNNFKTNGIARINSDGSLDTTFKFSLDKFPFLKNVDSYDRYFFRPKIISPLINGDLIVAFLNNDFEAKDNRRTFKLDRFGNLKNEFGLDGNPIFSFNKVQDFGNGKYLVHRVENIRDNDLFYNLGPYLDINVTDTNGNNLNQLLLSREMASQKFHLVKVKVIDSSHYLLAYCLQTEIEGTFEKGDFYIYKLSTTDQTVGGLTPLYYKKLEEFTYIDLKSDDNWNLKIQDKDDENLFTIIYLDSFGKEIYSFKTNEPYAIYFPQIKLNNNVKLSLTNSYSRNSYEWFYLQNEAGDRLQTQSDDFTGMLAIDREGYYNYLEGDTRIQKINDSIFWFISDLIVFPKDNSSSVSGFFRIKIEETKITSEPDQLNAKVFPNPTNGSASIELPFYYDDGLRGNLMVADISGKQMYKESFTLLKYENLKFDFSRYNSGLYFVRVETNGRVYYTKVIKR